MLNKESDIKIIGAFDDRDFAVDKIAELKPHIVLLDLGLAHQNSLKLVNSIKSLHSNVKIIVMDLVPVQEDILRFVEAGVSGFILKDATIAEFIKTIRTV